MKQWQFSRGWLHRGIFYRILIVACLFGGVEVAVHMDERRLLLRTSLLHAAGTHHSASNLPVRNAAEPFHLLVFSKTAGYRHASITAGQDLLRDLAAANNFTVQFSEDAAIFTDAALADMDGILFLNTTGDILDDEQQAAFERFIRAGKGFIGVHSASDTEYGWPWYGGLVGTYFADHPAVQDATVTVRDRHHPSTVGLPDPWLRRDEWYNFQRQPSGVNVLLAVDEASYAGGTMGIDHPIAWYHAYDGGRSWYTAMGHTAESFAEPFFQQHLLGGILWAVNPSDTHFVFLPVIYLE
jgi:type 1 glutamine amidotransferase